MSVFFWFLFPVHGAQKNGVHQTHISFFGRVGGDCVESYLMNCFKGHHDWKVPIKPASYHENFTILHPFLLFTKDNFKYQCVKNCLMRFVCEDETNEQNICRRNFVRNTILPLLNQEGIFVEKVVRKKYLEYTHE